MTKAKLSVWTLALLGLFGACSNDADNPETNGTIGTGNAGAQTGGGATGGTFSGTAGGAADGSTVLGPRDGGATGGNAAIGGGSTAGTAAAGGGSASEAGAGVGPRDAGLADSGSSDGGQTADGGNAGAANQTLPPVTDYAQEGPFKTIKETSQGPRSAHTIFRPDPLGADGFLHSPIIFGPGISTSGATQYDALLNHLASHGYVVMAINSISGGPGAAANDTAMRSGLDWLLMQNEATGPYQGKLAVERAITMGYSIGATSAVRIADHKAVSTSVAIHGHQQMSTGKPHGPVLLMTGNGSTEIPSGPQATLQAITSVPVILALYDGQRHVTVIQEQLAKGKPEFVLITAWLRYWINGDDAAKSHFWGASCKICMDPKWMVTTNAAWDAQQL
jgi:dienelactone hydrolase